MAGAVGVAGEGEDFGVVDESVDHGGGDDVVGEGFAPSIWGWLMFAGAWLRLVPGQKRSRLIY
ncbi:hypothetical protein GCM10022255_116670 [Dactylosporangium darangshiense]|uniref:Uncharacterized protein n=1 Tax=Dactylosporangium darangshiense TaxID=579108 RepID=A0ABP8DWD7_9ACTN